MNPFLDLQKLLVDRKVVLSGTVVKVDVGKLHVRTAAGVVFASVTDATNYQVGDDVLVDSGVVKGKLRQVSSIPTYYV